MNEVEQTEVYEASQVKPLGNLDVSLGEHTIFASFESTLLALYKERDLIRALKYDDLEEALFDISSNEMLHILFTDGGDEEREFWSDKMKEKWVDITMLRGERQTMIAHFESELRKVQERDDQYEFDTSLRLKRMIGRLRMDDLRAKRLEVTQLKRLKETLEIFEVRNEEGLHTIDGQLMSFLLEETNAARAAIEKEVSEA